MPTGEAEAQPVPTAPSAGEQLLEQLARLSPSMDDKYARPEDAVGGRFACRCLILGWFSMVFMAKKLL